ncbi:MAG: HD-GYP domain-containing protein [Clostridiales bacterium]|nr:HD-GYP domain-containing protein [Clostridiales bacterium]
MTTIKIVEKNNPIDIASQESSQLKLLAKSHNLEIMEQIIFKDKMFIVYPADTENLFEFFYIISGSIQSEILRTTLCQGDSFHFNALVEVTHFKALSDTRILYVINDSIFHLLSDEIKTLYEMMNSIEKKDAYTKKHCQRVQQYAYKIAVELKLDNETIESIQFAALFHDLGKIKIPDDILNKPEALSEKEYAIIKEHPKYSRDIITKLYFRDIEKIVLQHHERIDGSGYPNQLIGDDICIEAAIIAVADSYDAITSDRPYRSGLSKEIAVSELIKFKGTHYRNDVVDAFLNILLS